MLASALAALALGGEPQCPPALGACYYSYSNAVFGDPLSVVRGAGKPYKLGIRPETGAPQSAVCNPYNWQMREQCHLSCPLSLRITDPPHLAMRVCVNDNVFTPYDPSAHLDLNHKLNGRSLKLATPPKEHRMGCLEENYNTTNTTLNYTDKLMVVRRGGCYFAQKFHHASKAGALTGLMVNIYNIDDIESNTVTMSGGTDQFPQPGFPAGGLPKHAGDILLDALDNGTDIYGQIEFQCNGAANVTEPEVYPEWDGCPSTKLIEVCEGEAQESHRLCSKCPANFTLAVAGKVHSTCLWGNFLLPRVPANRFQSALEFPHTFDYDKVAFVDNLPDGGCKLSDFDGLEGKVVFMKQPQGCLDFQAARLASERNLMALVFVHREAGGRAEEVDGPSNFVAIPIHSVAADDYAEFAKGLDTATLVTTGVNGSKSWYEFAADAAVMTVVEGDVRPRPEEKTIEGIVQAEAAAPISIPEFEFSGTVIACKILIVVFLVLLVLLYLYQRRHAVELPSEDGREKFAVPLGVASMGLSLSLLIIIAVVAFMLAYSAGQDARETAVKNGQDAAGITYENAVGNVAELSKQQRENVLDAVEQGIDRLIDQGEMLVEGTATIFMGVAENPTWGDFAGENGEILATFINHAQTAWAESWRLHVFTTNGLLASRAYITDHVQNKDLYDNEVGFLNETNNATLYGTQLIRYIPDTYTHELWARQHPFEFNVSQMEGASKGDPLQYATKNTPRGMNTWRVSKTTYPVITSYEALQPITVYTPIKNRDGKLIGVADAQLELNWFATLLNNLLSSPGLSNMTLVIFDLNDKSLVASNRHGSSKRRAILNGFAPQHLYGLYTLYDVTAPEIVGGARFMQKSLAPEGGDWDADKLKSRTEVMRVDSTATETAWGFRGEFDQRDEYVQGPLRVMDFHFKDGEIVDATGDANEAVLVRNGTQCTQGVDCTSVRDNREVLRFDGDDVLTISKVLTPKVPRVSMTRIETNGTWASSAPEFQRLMKRDPSRNLTEDNACVSRLSRINSDPQFDTEKCIGRESWLRGRFTVHMSVKPDETIDAPGQGAGPPTSDVPTLFTDVRSGDPSFRIYGNGQLFMNTLRYGCRTDPVPGGLPGGVWTTITGVRTARSCAIYVNGTLVQRAQIGRNFFLQDKEADFEVGRGLKGEIDAFAVYNESLGGDAIRGLHETGVLDIQVPPRDWFMDVRKVDKETDFNLRSGIMWGVMAMLPREDIMRKVDANNDITMRNLKIQEDNTQKRLNQRNNETVMIVVLLALLSVFVFLMFNDLLTKPFAQTAIVMTDAAVMRIEEVDEKHSFLLELNAMNRAMALMCKNLKEYRSYMPQTLILEDEDDSSDADTAASASRKSSAASRSNAASRRSGGGQSFASFMSKSAGASQAAKTAVAAVEKRQGMVLSLQRKKVSFVVGNVSGWLGQIASMADREVVRVHGEILSLALAAFAANKGVSEVFSGDRFVASFNAAKNCGTHRTNACAAACLMKHDLAEKLPATQMHFACVSGDGRVGNCGNETMKKYTFMTPVLTWAFGLERIARTHELAIAADNFVFEDASMQFTVKVAFDVIFAKRAKKSAIRVAEIMGKKASGESDEWLYELEDAAAKDPYTRWNKFADAVLGQNWDNAAAHAAEASEIDNGPLFQFLAQQLEDKAVKPVSLMYH